MNEKIKDGDLVPVIKCKNVQCGHVTRVKAVPADDEGQPYAQFRHVCPKCGEDQTVQLSEVQIAKAHRKQ